MLRMHSNSSHCCSSSASAFASDAVIAIAVVVGAILQINHFTHNAS